jgi:hypothetical protein
VTTDQSPEPIVAAALRHAADLLESRQYVRFGGGNELWSVLHMTGADVIAGPAAEHLRKLTGTRQLQHWTGTQQEAAALLRAAAEGAPPLADAQSDAALADMELARHLLRTALAYDGKANDERLGTLANQMGHRTRLQESQIGDLENETARLSQKVRDLEAENAALRRGTPSTGLETFGPFDSRDDVHALPVVQAAYDAASISPRRAIMEERNHRLLCKACADAGITVGAYDHQILLLIAGYEPETCAVIAGLIRRAAAGKDTQ